MPTSEIILHYFEVFLGWPVIILIVFIIFKGAISDFLRRLVKGEALGMRLEARKPFEQQKETRETLPAKSDAEIENYISDNPSLLIEEYKKVAKALMFERVFNVIYGTQISLLEHLSKKGSEGDKYINLVSFYNECIKLQRNSSYQRVNYFGFLKECAFIEYSGEGSDKIVKITPRGIDFLSYISANYPLGFKFKQY